MRVVADAESVRRFMKELGRATEGEASVYFVGGASAVLFGWRTSTIDLDLKVVSGDDAVLKALPPIKDRLGLNIELAAPDQFIPPLPGWMERSPSIGREGRVIFHHYDFYSQALAKIERGHRVDMEDARAMMRLGLIEGARLREFFHQIEPALFRYPAIDPKSFHKSVEEFLRLK